MLRIYLSILYASSLVLPLYIIISLISCSAKNRKKAIEKATAKGHIVEARLIDIKRDPYDDGGDQKDGLVMIGKYKYIFENKTYYYQHRTTGLPLAITLYFLRSPRRAVVKEDLELFNLCWPLIYIFTFVLFYGLSFLMI